MKASSVLRVDSYASPPSPLLDVQRGRGGVIVTCCSIRSHNNIPKLESFNKTTKFDRFLKDPPLIQKSENELSDYCSVLEGDESYSCWRAYFELKDLERESPKEEVEKLIIESGGVRTLIGCLHGIAEIHKGKKNTTVMAKQPVVVDNNLGVARNDCPIPDGLPKTMEELAEEESARMPDSPYTRLLRARGTFPAWYSQTPDHETD
ncbi:hypothetical protein ACFE04_021793 [Oxalis oulophora]